MQSSELSHSWTELIDMLHMLLDAVYASFSQMQPKERSFGFFFVSDMSTFDTHC